MMPNIALLMILLPNLGLQTKKFTELYKSLKGQSTKLLSTDIDSDKQR